MTDQTITCPKCHHKIPLTEALSHQIKEELSKEAERLNKEKEADFAKKEAYLRKQHQDLLQQQKSIEEEVAKKSQKREQELRKELEVKLRKDVTLEVEELRKESLEKAKLLEEAQKNELEARKKMQDIEARERSLDLEVQRKLDQEREVISSRMRESFLEEYRMKSQEKDKQIDQMNKTIEELKRRGEQGSMQIQGDVQENDLRDTLKQTFPQDEIADVPTGINGADLVQIVYSRQGHKAGVILWESKNTKGWTEGWIRKLKDDQMRANADICILTSRALPESIKTFGEKDGVWVCGYQYAVALAMTLRLTLMRVQEVKVASKGKNEKIEVLYEYLTGSQFKNKIEGIVSAFVGMQKDLDSERRAMRRIWNKREKEIERVIESTSGMYGDLQGIAGMSALPEIESLSLPGGEKDV